MSETQTSAVEYRRFWEDEKEAAYRYRMLAEAATPEQRPIFIALADVEERHAAHWAKKLGEIGERLPDAYTPSLAVKLDLFLAKRIGIRSAVAAMERKERESSSMYDGRGDVAEGMAAEERGHGAALARMLAPPRSGGDPRVDIQRYERWHKADSSGAVRAAVFGINDGLVANASLVMGVAGGTPDRHIILLAGISGLLAGAFSMGAGEFISVASQRELFEHEIEVEAREIDEQPEEETEELALIYQAKGVPKSEAEEMSRRIMADRSQAIDTLSREELGLNPDELGSPWRVAISSFVAFIIGAAVPVLPFVFISGTPAVILSFACFALALVAVGSSIGIFAGRSPWVPALRQLVVGAAASLATFGIGRLIGNSLRGG